MIILLIQVVEANDLQKFDCAAGYQSQCLNGGYTDSLTEENTATVSFDSNAFTSMEETRGYAMRLSAEVTLKNGFDYLLTEGDNQ